jgi:hypothetical protein
MSDLQFDADDVLKRCLPGVIKVESRWAWPEANAAVRVVSSVYGESHICLRYEMGPEKPKEYLIEVPFGGDARSVRRAERALDTIRRKLKRELPKNWIPFGETEWMVNPTQGLWLDTGGQLIYAPLSRRVMEGFEVVPPSITVVVRASRGVGPAAQEALELRAVREEEYKL